MWSNDPSTAESLASLGFKTIECADRAWPIDVALVANEGVTTNAGVMIFRSAKEYDETVECIRTFQPTNPAAVAKASAFEDPAKAIEQFRAMCMIGAAPDSRFLRAGSKVLVLDRAGRLVKLKVVGGKDADGKEAGSIFYAPPQSIGG